MEESGKSRYKGDSLYEHIFTIYKELNILGNIGAVFYFFSHLFYRRQKADIKGL